MDQVRLNFFLKTNFLITTKNVFFFKNHNLLKKHVKKYYNNTYSHKKITFFQKKVDLFFLRSKLAKNIIFVF